MKFLFKLIVIPTLSMLALPAAFLALAYKSVSIPIEEFESISAAPLSQMVEEELDAFLSSNDSNASVGVSVAQSDANAILKAQFLEINDKYLDPNATEDERNYVIKEDYFGYQGSWVRMKDNSVEIESGIHVFYNGFTFKTRLLIVFKLEVTTEEIVLTLDKLTIGNLPLAWTFSTASWAAERVLGQDIKSIIDEQLNGIAEFDPQKREIRVNVDTLLEETMSSDPKSLALVRSLLAFIEENDLLTIGFIEGEFEMRLKLGKTRDTVTPIFAVSESQRILNDEHLQAIFASRVNALVLSGIYSQTPYIDLDAVTLNRVFEYFLRNPEHSLGVIVEAEIYEGYHMKALMPFISFSDGLIVNIPLIIEKADDTEKTFRTVIKIEGLPSVDGNDLIIQLNSLIAGEVTLTSEHIDNILTMIGDNEVIRDGALVLENFDEQMSQAGLSIQNVTVVNQRLRLHVSLSDVPYVEVQQAIKDVIQGVSNNANYSPVLNDALNNVFDSLADPEAEPEAAVQQLLEVVEGLSDEEQEQLMNDLLAEFENTDLDFETIFGLLP